MKILKKLFVLVMCCTILLGLLPKAYAQETDGKITSAVATINENQVIVDIVSEGFEEESMAVASLIDTEGNTVCVNLVKLEHEIKIPFTKGKTGVKVKIFIWKDAVSMQPLCEVKITGVTENKLYGKKLYVDGDSICYGNGYKGGFGKIIADNYGMTLTNAGAGGATISNMGATNKVKYSNSLDWDNTQYYLKLTGYDPFADKSVEGFAYPITKEQYENGFGVYPTAYVMQDGNLTELEYSETMPNGRFYVKFDVPTYDNHTVPKYYRMWKTNNWLWDAYKSGFKGVHESGEATIATARHWLSTSVNNIDNDADYIIFEGGINDYLMNRPLGKLTEGTDNVVDTTTLIGGLEYVCRTLKGKDSNSKVLYVITPRAREYTTKPNGNAAGNKTWQDYHDAIVSVLKKYGIEYVDLFEIEFDTAKEEYLQYTVNIDGVHPTKEGYEKFFVPYIVETMQK